MLDKLFQLSERGTTVKTEILAGITTFITMAYILFLAPNILSLAGMDKDAVLIATALGGGLVTIAMGLFVNYPIALAPGVGLLAFYSFTVVLGMGVSWQTALGAVFISGLVFLVLTLTSIRQMIVEGIPALHENCHYRWYWSFHFYHRFKVIRLDGYLHKFVSKLLGSSRTDTW